MFLWDHYNIIKLLVQGPHLTMKNLVVESQFDIEWFLDLKYRRYAVWEAFNVVQSSRKKGLKIWMPSRLFQKYEWEGFSDF